jgi:hypothetical protein
MKPLGDSLIASRHDYFCPGYIGVPSCYCPAIAEVRADERAKVLEEIAQKKDWCEY